MAIFNSYLTNYQRVVKICEEKNVINWLVVTGTFGLFFHMFPFSWEWKIIPTDFQSIIFQRGRYTTNQIKIHS